MKIAIIDGVCQDYGLKLLFEESDYYIVKQEYKRESPIFNNIKINYDLNNINDKRYDYLFIVIALYDTLKGTQFYKKGIENIFNNIRSIIENNNFKKVFIFDNYDYDYDPNYIYKNNKVIYFKRNYNRNKTYAENVVPFPFIMFGKISIIEKILYPFIYNVDVDNVIDRVFFSGHMFNHIDKHINYYRNRNIIYNSISNYIYNPNSILQYEQFMKNICLSKFSLDLNGVGDPNKRTFEILSTNSLRIGEYNELKWPFEDEDNFCNETIFKNKDDFKNKLTLLRNDKELYNKCLTKQKYIYNKYMNKEWLKKYIIKYL